MKRLLIVGCGDVARRALPLLATRYRPLYALSRSDAGRPPLRAAGVRPVAGDLDRPDSLGKLAGLAGDILYSAPPPAAGARDTRLARLLAALSRRKRPPLRSVGMLARRFVYLSTSGVYGDCGGAEVPETRPLHPDTDRARRRADAEARIRAWGRRNAVAVVILRVPGIYAADRLPLDRLRAGGTALAAEHDAFTNHIHADDLARIVVAALRRGRGGRAYNTSDDSRHRLGEYLDLVADRFGLPRPRRVGPVEAERALPPTLLSFMRESRRLLNARVKRELRVRLRYPTVADGLRAVADARPTP